MRENYIALVRRTVVVVAISDDCRYSVVSVQRAQTYRGENSIFLPVYEPVSSAGVST